MRSPAILPTIQPLHHTLQTIVGPMAPGDVEITIRFRQPKQEKAFKAALMNEFNRSQPYRDAADPMRLASFRAYGLSFKLAGGDD